MHWDLFCRVIDNHGDLGVCWRLAADLASRGERVRLVVDDPSALSWMAPHGAPGVMLVRWPDPWPEVEPGDVVVEAFGCDLPPALVARMATRDPSPLWINLEYLSAEDYIERSHGLPSPQSNGLTRWFFYPGFTPATGGLLRETQALEAAAPDWLAAQGIVRSAGERCISLFAYADAPFDALFEHLDDQPTLLLLAAGASQAPALARFNAARRRGRYLRAHALPWFDQPGYDLLLRACDLNFARGEDSIVRAMWAGAPFVWQIYTQADGAHAVKLDALLERLSTGASEALATDLRGLWRAWNGLGEWPTRWPDTALWRAQCQRWREHLAAQPELCSQLFGFVAAKR